MSDILVRPFELRNISVQLKSSAQKIEIALQTIDNDILSLKGDTFLGNRANTVQSHYAPRREALLKARDIVTHFAEDLQNTAAVFENADRGSFMAILPSSAGSMWGGDFVSIILPGFVANLFRTISPWSSLKLPQWLTEKLDGVFKPAEIVTPLLKEPPVFEKEQPLTGFGKLLQQEPSPTASEQISPAASPGNDPVAGNGTSSISGGPDAVYAVPVKAQGELYGNAACVPTSVSMVLDYYNSQSQENKTISPQGIIDMMDAGDGMKGKGMSPSKLTDELGDLGYNNITQQVGAQYSDLQSSVQDGPVIVTIGAKLVGDGIVNSSGPRVLEGPGNIGHAIVVTGVGENLVYVNDPWSGQALQLSQETFEKMWSHGSRGLFSIRP